MAFCDSNPADVEAVRPDSGSRSPNASLAVDETFTLRRE